MKKESKTFGEWISDFLSSVWKRFLFGAVILAAGILLVMCVPGLLAVGVLMVFFGMGTVVSLFDSQKCYYVNSLSLPLSSDEKATCVVFKEKSFMTSMFPLSLVCLFSPFFYFPYKTRYVIVKNMTMSNTRRNTRVSLDFLNLGLLDVEKITPREYGNVCHNPSILSEKFNPYLGQKRDIFEKETKPFFETGVMTEIFHNNQLSICKLPDDEYMIFHYQSYSGKQCGMLINGDFVDKIIQDPGFLLESYLSAQNPIVVLLTDELLERILIEKNKAGEANNEKAEEFIMQQENDRPVFTKQMIEKMVADTGRKKKTGGIALLISGLPFIGIGMMGLTGGGIVGVLFLAGGIVCLYFGIRNIRRNRMNKKNALQGNYKIIKTKCVEHREIQETDDGFDTGRVTHIYEFANGDKIELNYFFAAPNDTAYLVYLEKSKKINACFNAKKYKPAPDLQIIDMTE